MKSELGGMRSASEAPFQNLIGFSSSPKLTTISSQVEPRRRVDLRFEPGNVQQYSSGGREETSRTTMRRLGLLIQ